jgi:thiamine-monophosphate kinase
MSLSDGPHTPFTSDESHQVASLGESRLIEAIREWLGASCPAFPEGIGDDCAINPTGVTKAFQLTTIDGVGWLRHFNASMSPQSVGRKLLARNLSDIASCGGIPLRAVLSLWMSPATDLRWLEGFYHGIAALAIEHQVAIVGGDLAAADSETFIANLCLIGHCDRPLMRKQCQPGDSIWVSGPLGGSLLGKNHQFQPRLEEGRWLALQSWTKGCIDLSDGMAKDLPALIGSHDVVIHHIPISEAAKEMAQMSGQSALQHALTDGEDYELLFACDRNTETQVIRQEWEKRFSSPLHLVGTVGPCNPEGKTRWSGPDFGENLAAFQGYEHF